MSTKEPWRPSDPSGQPAKLPRNRLPDDPAMATPTPAPKPLAPVGEAVERDGWAADRRMSAATVDPWNPEHWWP